MIKTTAIIAAKIKAQVTTELKTTGKQFKVGMLEPSTISTQLVQSGIN